MRDRKRLRRSGFLWGMLFCGAVCAGAARAETGSPAVLIKNVTVIDTHGGPSQPDMTVLVRGGRIASVSKGGKRAADGATLVDGRGKFLIPGLWDMEVHLSWTRECALPVLVATGVTDVRDMGSDLREIEGWKTRMKAGLLTGPHILDVGPMLNGKSFNRYQFAVGGPEETRGVVRTLKYLGVNGLEIERRFPRESYFALADEAKKTGLPLGGHVPLAVSPVEVSKAGQTTIEDVETIYYGTISTEMKEDDQAKVVKTFLASDDSAKLLATFLNNHTAITPVLAMLEWTVDHNAPGSMPDPEMRYVARSMREEMLGKPPSPEDTSAMERELPLLFESVRRMHEAGITLLAGTDIAADRIPGFSLQKEIEALPRAGLTPLEAIQTATLNPAMVMKREADYGSIEAGKVADMVLLEGDPLQDIRNIERISAVFLDGKVLDRKDLDGLLKQGETLAAQN